VSDNKRFLQHEDGAPFFYLGDTAWELFLRLDRSDADLYLTDRARKGYTVIQAVAINEFNETDVNIPNSYGHRILDNSNPATPALKDGDDNDYWDHVDYIVNKANSLGMYIGFLPSWGKYWHDEKPLFNTENAYKYGLFLGKRYKDRQIIWILGGDRSVDNDRQREIIKALAKGLREGDEGAHLISFHPSGGRGSAEWFHEETWLDFNMRQNGHNSDYTGNYSKTLDDYRRAPAKPVMDGEPLYEDHPLSFNAARLGHSIAADVRRAMYWDLFNGAFGHTYGHHSVWQMYDPEKKRSPVNNPLMPWKEAINQPGAGQMMYGRKLIESRPFLTRIPDPSIIVTGEVATSIPGEGRYRFVATRDEAGTYAMIYAPCGRNFTVRTDVIKGKKIKAWWFNPRNGKAISIGTFDNNSSERTFSPPDKGEETDWILVLDDAARKYPAPAG
ncbi:MAG: glycoside hydrolase family 140 protein, partial [Tannerella sp.]|nr:glycoside hydrolase family 140 protein [Tannerella sp.]